MTKIAWKDAKRILRIGLDEFLGSTGFSNFKGGITWYRYVNDVCQIIEAEKLKGSSVRLRVFVRDDAGLTIGGNLTHLCIEGGGTVGGDYFWPVDSRTQLDSTISDVIKTLGMVAMPWFNMISTTEKLRKSRNCYTPKSYVISESFPSANKLVLEEIETTFADQNEIVEYILSSDAANTLSSKGFSQLDNTSVFFRSRGEVFDVVEFVPVNYGAHVVCYAYNWLKELSSCTDGAFNTDTRVILVGGLLEDDDAHGNLFLFGTIEQAKTSLEFIEDTLVHIVFPKLESVKTKADFVEAVDPVHKPSLRAFGLL